MQRSKDFFSGVYRLRPYENIKGCVKKCFEFSKSNFPLIMALMLAMFFALLWYSTYLENQQIKIQKDEMTDQIIWKGEFIKSESSQKFGLEKRITCLENNFWHCYSYRWSDLCPEWFILVRNSYYKFSLSLKNWNYKWRRINFKSTVPHVLNAIKSTKTTLTKPSQLAKITSSINLAVSQNGPLSNPH